MSTMVEYTVIHIVSTVLNKLRGRWYKIAKLRKNCLASADHYALQPTFQLLLKPKPIHYLFSEMDYDTAVESYLMM